MRRYTARFSYESVVQVVSAIFFLVFTISAVTYSFTQSGKDYRKLLGLAQIVQKLQLEDDLVCLSEKHVFGSGDGIGMRNGRALMLSSAENSTHQSLAA